MPGPVRLASWDRAITVLNREYTRDDHGRFATTADPLTGDAALASPTLSQADLDTANDPRAGSLWYRTGDNSTDTTTGMPGFMELNAYMRTGRGGGHLADIVADIDSIMTGSPLRDPVTVYRGTYTFDVDGLLGDGDLIGTEFTDRAFVSTTTDRQHAGKFGDVVLRITAPAGTKAVRLGDRDLSAPESEIMLDRDLKFKVVADTPAVMDTTGPRPRTVEKRVIDIEVLP